MKRSHITLLLVLQTLALLMLVGLAVLPEATVAARYLGFSATEGDCLNDWLTHASPALADLLKPLGCALAHQITH